MWLALRHSEWLGSEHALNALHNVVSQQLGYGAWDLIFHGNGAGEETEPEKIDLKELEGFVQDCSFM